MKRTFFLLALLLPLVLMGQGLNRSAGYRGALTPMAASGAAWTPTTPANTLTEWLKADTLSGTNDGAHVTNWIAAAGNNATGTNSADCIFKTAIKNSLPVVRFQTAATTGTSGSHLQTANWGAALSQPYTVLAVFNYLGGAGQNQVMWSGTANRISFNHVVSGDRFACYAETGADFGYMGSADASWHVVMIEYNGASTKYRFDGGSEQTVGISPGTATWQGLTLGALENFTQPVDADFGEIIIYSGALSSGDKTSAFSYLNTRWAVY